MKELLSILKVDEPGFEKALEGVIHCAKLNKGEMFPTGIKEGTWLFVEKGFIMKRILDGGNDVDDLLPERNCLLLTGPSATDSSTEGIAITALEPTTIYYLAKEEVDQLAEQYPSFAIHHFAITINAGNTLRKQSEIWSTPSAERLQLVMVKYPFLLRAGPRFLADYLRLTGREHTQLLAQFN